MKDCEKKPATLPRRAQCHTEIQLSLRFLGQLYDGTVN